MTPCALLSSPQAIECVYCVQLKWGQKSRPIVHFRMKQYPKSAPEIKTYCAFPDETISKVSPAYAEHHIYMQLLPLTFTLTLLVEVLTAGEDCLVSSKGSISWQLL